jgi:anti-anti-sigma factor
VGLRDGDEVRLAVSGGFPDGEYSFTFKTAGNTVAQGSGDGRAQGSGVSRHTIREGTFEVDSSGPTYLYRLSGVFRRHECDAFAGSVMDALKQEPRHVVLEMSRVEYMNSYGLGVLVRISQDLGTYDRRIALAGAQGLVLKLFQTVGIDQRLPCYPSEKEAVAVITDAQA